MANESYLQIALKAEPEFHAMLIALMAELDYYAFEEQEAQLLAYIMPEDFREQQLASLLAQWFPQANIGFTKTDIEAKDWNAEWERNFESILVGDFCEIRPPFRPSQARTQYDLVVMPKMAFGTGHHSTTWLMVEQMKSLDFTGKNVLDMGCGTGLLGILARKLGAKEVTLIDIDSWSTENTAENARLNEVEGLNIIEGDRDAIPADACYDIILANINRNVLLADRDTFLLHLKRGGKLVLSGIYDFDEEKLRDHYTVSELEFQDRAERNEWVRLTFQKR